MVYPVVAGLYYVYLIDWQKRCVFIPDKEVVSSVLVVIKYTAASRYNPKFNWTQYKKAPH